MPQTKAQTGSARSRLLAAAADCFYDRGVNATGIDTVISTAGVAKMSLYNNFSSKDDLVLTYLDARHEEWLGLYECRVRGAETPRDKVAAVFDAYADHADMAYRNGFRGCGLLNAAAELPAGAPGRQVVRRHKEHVEALLAGHLRELVGETAAADLAQHLSFVLEGAIARAGLEGDARLLARARSIGLKTVDDACAAR